MRKLLFILLLFGTLVARGQEGAVVISKVSDTTATAHTNFISALESAGYGYEFWNAQATTPHWDHYTDAGLEHVFTFEGSGGGAWGTITGTLSDQTDLQTELDAKADLANTATALTDGSAVTIAGAKNTLASTEPAITFTITHPGDFTTTLITLTGTSATYTFPAGSLCSSDGFSSGDNTLAIAGDTGDKYILTTEKFGSIYIVICKNMKQ